MTVRPSYRADPGLSLSAFERVVPVPSLADLAAAVEAHTGPAGVEGQSAGSTSP